MTGGRHFKIFAVALLNAYSLYSASTTSLCALDVMQVLRSWSIFSCLYRPQGKSQPADPRLFGEVVLVPAACPDLQQIHVT